MKSYYSKRVLFFDERGFGGQFSKVVFFSVSCNRMFGWCGVKSVGYYRDSSAIHRTKPRITEFFV